MWQRDAEADSSAHRAFAVFNRSGNLTFIFRQNGADSGQMPGEFVYDFKTASAFDFGNNVFGSKVDLHKFKRKSANEYPPAIDSRCSVRYCHPIIRPTHRA